MRYESRMAIIGSIPVSYIMGMTVWCMLGLKDIVPMYNMDFVIVFGLFGFIIIIICWMFAIASIHSFP